MSVIKAQLLAKKHEFGGYVLYVFRNLENNSWLDKYIMLIRFPNWQTAPIKIGTVGFVEYKEVEAGKSTWWDNNTQTNIAYKYDNIIFQNFIPEPTTSDLTVML